MLRIREPDAFERIERLPFEGLGVHYLADFHGCRCLPGSASELEGLMVRAATAIRATVVSSSFHQFSPHGLSGVVVIAESHFAAHTWPEHRVACIDLFTCSTEMDATQGLRLLFEAFVADSMELTRTSRAGRMKGPS